LYKSSTGQSALGSQNVAARPGRRAGVTQAKPDEARLEVRNLIVMQMQPGLSARELEKLRKLEQLARQEVKVRKLALDQAKGVK
jgi:hypothetical protein